MVIYSNYTTDKGVERVKTFSDRNVYIERDGEKYTDADDFVYQNRVYTETDKPIESTSDLTVEDTLGMLSEMGVDTDDQ